jgi:uncharacterized protein (DUF4415 family)
MQVKKKPGSEWTDPDDAPLLTQEMLAHAEIFEGDKFVKRGPGRPKIANPKEPVQLRLDRDVINALRASGPGWQTKINDLLRRSLGLATG